MYSLPREEGEDVDALDLITLQRGIVPPFRLCSDENTVAFEELNARIMWLVSRFLRQLTEPLDTFILDELVASSLCSER